MIIGSTQSPIQSFDRLIRTSGNLLKPFVVSLSNHIQINPDHTFPFIGAPSRPKTAVEAHQC